MASSNAYSSQTVSSGSYSPKAMYDDCIMMSDEFKLNEYDPLNALHEHNLATNPDLDVSVLTDDELIALLKSAKEPKDLAYLNWNTSKQIVDGKSIISVDSPAYTRSEASSAFSQSSSSQNPQ